MPTVLLIERREKSASILKTLFEKQGHKVYLSDGHTEPPGAVNYVVTEIWDDLPVLNKMRINGENPQVLHLKNFSRDEYLEQLFLQPEDLQLDQSYKLRDLITVTDGFLEEQAESQKESMQKLFDNPNTIDFFEHNYESRKLDFLNHIELDLFKYFGENGLIDEISEETLLRVLFGGLLDSALSAQQASTVSSYEIQLRIAYDEEKIGISLTSPVNNHEFKSEIFQRLTNRIQGKEQPEEETLKPKASANGRGFFVIQSGMHRLSLQLSKLQTEESPSTWESSILLYRKNKVGKTAARAFSMVVAF